MARKPISGGVAKKRAKRITAKQRVARVKNIEIARRHKKKATGKKKSKYSDDARAKAASMMGRTFANSTAALKYRGKKTALSTSWGQVWIKG